MGRLRSARDSTHFHTQPYGHPGCMAFPGSTARMSPICKCEVTCPVSHCQSAIVMAGAWFPGLEACVFSILPKSKMVSPRTSSCCLSSFSLSPKPICSGVACCVAAKGESALSGTFPLLLWQQRCSGLGTIRLCVMSWCFQGLQPRRGSVSWRPRSLALCCVLLLEGFLLTL